MRFHFADCILDTDRHELLRGGQRIEVEPQVFDLLELLVRNSGLLLSKDRIVQDIWAGRIVSDSAITARTAAVRKAVGDSGKTQTIIRTVARKGLQLVADVTVEAATDGAPRPPGDERQKIRFASASGGATLAYCITGKGPPLVRAAHFPSNIDMEPNDTIDKPTIDRIASRHSVLQFDWIGTGLSSRKLDDPDPAVRARDIGTAADAAGFDRFALFGQSGGVMAAVHYAAAHPDRVSRLILQGGYVDGRALRGENPATGGDFIELMLREGWNTPNSTFVSSYLSLYFPGATRAEIAHAAELVQNSSSAENVLKYRAVMNRASIADVLPRLTMPVLVVHSRLDSVHPLPEAQKLAAGIRNAELAVFDSANHYIMPIDACWEDHLRVILNFLDA